nr:aminoglycoside phosphotransferase family protein [Desulfobacter latus]
MTSIDLNSQFQLYPIFHGGNNRAWKIKTETNTYFLKHYFVSDQDKRDRFGTEITFINFMQKLGIRAIPSPIAANRAHNLGLFSFLPGQRLDTTPIKLPFIQQSLAFLKQLNSDRTSIESQALPLASDACFTIKDHMLSLQSRLDRLMNIQINDRLDQNAIDFVANDLVKEWVLIHRTIEESSKKAEIHIEQSICGADRMISPSDFGFHNVILSPKGELFFVDFEYAGWDDPAKLICDFFCQPDISTPFNYFSYYIDEIQAMIGGGQDLTNRVKLLFPLYRLKWCCIILNDFIQNEKERKDFAFFKKDRREKQFYKAVKYIKGH